MDGLQDHYVVLVPMITFLNQLCLPSFSSACLPTHLHVCLPTAQTVHNSDAP